MRLGELLGWLNISVCLRLVHLETETPVIKTPLECAL